MKNKFMQWFLAPAAYAVWLALSVPEEWVSDSDYLQHKNTKVSLWISNGPLFLRGARVSPFDIGIIDRFILWRRIKEMRARAVFNAFMRAGLGEMK